MSEAVIGERQATPRKPAPVAGTTDFFDCTFLGCPRELPGPEAYVIFMDDNSDGFTETLIRYCRGDDNFLGVARSLDKLPADGFVFCDGPTWDRCFEALQGAGVRGDRARVLLYFDDDASGFWDFAIACGRDLPKIFQEGVDTETLETLAPFLEHYSGGRAFKGRILPHAKFYTRDFLPLQIANGAAIARVMAAMADDQSRTDYARILFGANEQVFQAFTRAVFGPQQYMDIVKIRPGDVVINCGVSRGWEIPYFLSRLRGRGMLHSIDPNMQYPASPYAGFIERFRYMMEDHLIIAGDRDGRIRLGVKDANMIMSDMSQSSGSYTGEFVEFDCRSIDSMMRDGLANRLDYLKMDVEGGELTILKGAVETIRKYRPKLAVAIYHEPHHFWEYPAFILDHFEDYKFYLRQYGYSRFETLLYAIPKEAIEDGSGKERIRPAGASLGITPPAKQQLLYYMRDAAAHARDIYNGRKLGVARIFGSNWATAEILPGPWIDADEHIAVVEDDGQAQLFTYHRESDENARLTIGVSSGPTHIEWIASQGAPANGNCVVVEPAGEEIQVVLYDAIKGAASLVGFDFRDRGTHTLRPIRSFTLPARPVAAAWRGSNLEVICLDEDGAVLRALVGSDDQPRVASISVPAGRLSGIVTVRSYEAKGVRDEPAWAFLDDAGERLSAYRLERQAFEKIGEMDFDPRAKMVTTYVRPIRPR